MVALERAGCQLVGAQGARLGAALAYYSIFSTGPPIVIAIAIAGFFFGDEVVRAEVGAQLRGLLGDKGAQAVDTMLSDASKPKEGLLAALFGIGMLIAARAAAAIGNAIAALPAGGCATCR